MMAKGATQKPYHIEPNKPKITLAATNSNPKTYKNEHRNI
jgi:hypothetical protein